LNSREFMVFKRFREFKIREFRIREFIIADIL
jgi:hypothetical protein